MPLVSLALIFDARGRHVGAAALSAQIFPGDALVKINKTDTRNLSMEEVQDMLSGVCGKKVNVFVRRLGGDPRPACVELECASPSSRMKLCNIIFPHRKCVTQPSPTTNS